MKKTKYPVEKSEQEWRNQLDPLSYSVLRQQETEPPFTGEYDQHFELGDYYCKACGEKLYTSNCG